MQSPAATLECWCLRPAREKLANVEHLAGAQRGHVLRSFASSIVVCLCRNWNAIPPEQIEMLRTELLEFTVGQWGAIQPFIRTQLLAVVALIIKRAYLDESGTAIRAAFLEQAQTLAHGTAAMQAIGIRLMLALSDEFSFSRRSAVALSWEFHLKSRFAFQSEELQKLFVMAVEVLGRQLGASEFNEALDPALSLAVAVVSWDFKTTSSQSTIMNGFFRAQSEIQSNEVQFLKPDVAWRPTVTNPQLMDVFFSLAGQLRGEPPLAHKARQVLLHLSKLEGVDRATDVFANREERFGYYSQMLARTTQWLIDGQAGGQGYSSHPEPLA
eukprot:SAG31_NODE_442_length_15661_cov_4.132245_20_plen_326_part_01